jgi:hypothetical protein
MLILRSNLNTFIEIKQTEIETKWNIKRIMNKQTGIVHPSGTHQEPTRGSWNADGLHT